MQNSPGGRVQPAESSLTALGVWLFSFKEKSSALPDLLGSFSTSFTLVIYYLLITVL